MWEEARPYDYVFMAESEEDGDDGRVLEWEIGLPDADNLTPLSQSLISPELASAFRITPEPCRTILDVHRASQNTISNISCNAASSSSAVKSLPPFLSSVPDDPIVFEGDELANKDAAAEPSNKSRRQDSAAIEDGESSALRMEASNDDQSTRTLKRPRLVWTAQLHKRFVDVVNHLGIKNAVPKTIMQLMNVEGLTREKVASHLQKYRLYLKRMQGLSDEQSSSSDPLFASTPAPQSLREKPVPVPMPYPVPPMYPMPVYGMLRPHQHGYSAVGMMPVGNHQGGMAYHGFDPHLPYGAFGEMRNNWPGGNKFGSVVSYPRVAPNDK